MPKETKQQLRAIVIDVVKATDVARYHQVLVEELQEFNAREIKQDWRVSEGEPRKFTKKERLFVMKMIVKCADISNPARPQHM